jgi:hypothetical protein
MVKETDRRATAKSSDIEDGAQRRARLVRNRHPARGVRPDPSPPSPAVRPTHRGLPTGPDQHWDLGHDDLNPSMERPEHRACNRAAPNRLLTSREW